MDPVWFVALRSFWYPVCDSRRKLIAEINSETQQTIQPVTLASYKEDMDKVMTTFALSRSSSKVKIRRTGDLWKWLSTIVIVVQLIFGMRFECSNFLSKTSWSPFIHPYHL
ncbi:hypothetical protein CDAR_478481 [Caerostris darwini]|uniref:Uncharacterized protein n=1 Tax=Caerostris darwini TaxID=1538125 RepID=A0AAV4VCZ8_9ARAC|nr:hypothetical protein CDAR_478481 [Caerostris darwini]